MKELLASKSNDNFWMNDNKVYMSRGKVVNGESVGVGRVSELFVTEPTGWRREIRTSKFLRKGENPSKRPTPRQSEIDDTLRLKKSGQIVEPQVSFLDGKRCKYGTPGSIRKANDNVFLVNDNGIYMSKGKVVNGESVGVGRVIESFTFGPTRRLGGRGLSLAGVISKQTGISKWL